MRAVGMQGGRGDVSGGLVLVVDDDSMVVSVLDRILGAAGHRLAFAHSPEQVARFLFDPDLAVVLLDLCLGQAQGVDVLERIRGERPDIEIVVVTGQGSIDSAVHCIRRGAFDYLEKPFCDLARIRSAVGAALARHAATMRAEAEQPALAIDERTSIGTSFVQASVPLSLEAYERLALERALQESSGDARLAAHRLGIGRSTFYRKAAKLGIVLGRNGEDEVTADPGAGVGRGPSIG
jgi:two-component system response regulator HydG